MRNLEEKDVAGMGPNVPSLATIRERVEIGSRNVVGEEVYRNVGEGDKYPEPMFAILNYAKITDSPMEGDWVMEVDWVRHEFRR